jgi:hypothetical protein
MSDESNLPFFRLEAKPYTIPEDLARELAAIVIEWGGLENAVTVDLEQLRVWPIVRGLSDAMPSTFGAKLKLWRRSYATLFPTIKAYNDRVESIFAGARVVGLERHRIIHGVWMADQDNPGSFTVLAGIDRRKDIAYFQPNLPYLKAVHEDIKKLSSAVWSLNSSRQLHAVQGLLQRQPSPSGEHQVLRMPPSPEKP